MQVIIYILVGVLLFRGGRFLLNQLSKRFDKLAYQEDKEFKDFLIWMFVYCFTTTNGFSIFALSGNLVTRFLRDSPYRIVSFLPFKGIWDAIELNDFYDYVYGAREFGNLDLSYLIASYGALLFSGILYYLILYNRFKSRTTVLKIFVPTLIILYMYTSYELSSIAILIVVAGLIGFLLVTFGKKYLVFIYKMKPVIKGVNIQEIALALFVCGMFLFITNYSFQSYGFSSKVENYEVDGQIEMLDGQITMDLNNVRVYKDSIDFEGRIEENLDVQVPYEYERKNYELEYQIGGIDQEVGTSDLETSDSLYFMENRYISKRSNAKTKGIYPFKLYGISEITYVVRDPELMDQMVVEDEGWLEEEYLGYHYVIRVPKVPGFETDWNLNLSYDEEENSNYHLAINETVLEEAINYKVIDYKFYFFELSQDSITNPTMNVFNVLLRNKYTVDKRYPIIHIDTEEDLAKIK